MKHFPCAVLVLACMTGLAYAQQPATSTAATNAAVMSGVVPDANDASRVLNVPGVLNARDLGGLPDGQGQLPMAHFVRTADLSHMTNAGRTVLVDHGVRTDIDLRTSDEILHAPDPLAGESGIAYRHISLLDDKPIDMSAMPSDLGKLYVESLAHNQEQFLQVFQAIAAAPPGAVLYHCSAGKDRTGMISAMLLSLAGTPRADIVHDYAISANYLVPMMQSPSISAMVKKYPRIAPLMGTPPAAIEAFLDALDQRYGGAAAYLRQAGLSADQLTVIRQRLTGSGDAASAATGSSQGS